MAKKIDYASLFTLRKDGRYQKRLPDGRYLYDRDPEKLLAKIKDAQSPQSHIITFAEMAEQWEIQHRPSITERTWNNYKPHYDDIVDIHGSKAVADLTAMDVSNDLLKAKSRGCSATIINTRRILYNMICNYAVVQGFLQFNPVSAVKLPKGIKRGVREAPNDAVIKTVLSSVELPFGLFPFLLLCTGMRKSEALALTWGDVDLDEKTISVTKSIDYIIGAKPKTKSPKTTSGIRVIPIIDILLKELSIRKSAENDYLFPAQPSNRGGGGGGLMPERAYEGAWQRYCAYVGLVDETGKPILTAHNLRHGAATMMFEAGVDELTAQRILGHADINTTRAIYTHLRTKQAELSISKLNDSMSALMSKAV